MDAEQAFEQAKRELREADLTLSRLPAPSMTPVHIMDAAKERRRKAGIVYREAKRRAEAERQPKQAESPAERRERHRQEMAAAAQEREEKQREQDAAVFDQWIKEAK